MDILTNSLKRFFPIFLILLGIGIANQGYASDRIKSSNAINPPLRKKIIILSIDGFPAYYLDSPQVLKQIPHLQNFFKQAQGGRVKTVNPSLTYPAHTSMITGVDPGVHRIEGNTPVDPFYTLQGSWEWYYESIRVKTLVDFALEKNKTVAQVFWPVSVGMPGQYSIPQIWRTKTTDDLKLLRALSTPRLFAEMQSLVGKPVSEITGDDAKIRTAIQIYKLKNPDLLLIYSTDLDTTHHGYGPYSEQALVQLSKIDTLVGELIQETQLYKREDLALIIVSDHGFLRTEKICNPNRLLAEADEIRPQDKIWKSYFKTSGGFAYLVENPEWGEREKSTQPINRNDWRTRLAEACPGTRLVLDGEEFHRLKKTAHPSAQAFLLAEDKVAFGHKTTEPAFAQSQFYTHGFPNHFPEMDTILFFYSKGMKKIQELPGKHKVNPVGGYANPINPSPIESIKDSFYLACEWLAIPCRPGELQKNIY